jgi:ribosomal protein L29
MKKDEIKKLSEKALRENVESWRKELFNLKLSAASTHVKDNSQFKKLRVMIAQGLTYLRKKVSPSMKEKD